MNQWVPKTNEGNSYPYTIMDTAETLQTFIDTMPVKDIKEEGWITLNTEEFIIDSAAAIPPKEIKGEEEPVIKTEPIDIEPSPLAIEASPCHSETSSTNDPEHSSSISSLMRHLNNRVWHRHQPEAICL